MKKTGFLIVFAMLIMMGCSKDESTNDTTENNQLKKGSTNVSQGAAAIRFNGDSKGVEFLYVCPNGVSCERKLLQNGNFSGTFNGYGKVNPSLSTYSFSAITPKDNPFKQYEKEELYRYDITGNGVVAINTNDYFEISITGELSPWQNSGRFAGQAKVTLGFGKFRNFNKTFGVYDRGFGSEIIDLQSGNFPIYLSVLK